MELFDKKSIFEKKIRNIKKFQKNQKRSEKSRNFRKVLLLRDRARLFDLFVRRFLQQLRCGNINFQTKIKNDKNVESTLSTYFFVCFFFVREVNIRRVKSDMKIGGYFFILIFLHQIFAFSTTKILHFLHQIFCIFTPKIYLFLSNFFSKACIFS